MLMFSTSLGFSDSQQDRSQQGVGALEANSFFVSEVLDNLAHIGIMKVTAPAGGVIDAVAVIDQTGSGIYGPRKIGAAYPVHTAVVCYRPHKQPYCYVLGAVPQSVTSGKWNLNPDWIVPACSSGVGFDGVHWRNFITKNSNTSDINFSSGRPCDELPGDYGYINEWGVSFGLSRFMSWIKASHFCGVEAHWIDNLLRLIGHNLEEITSGSERRATNDDGEFTQITKWGPYPWETVGVIDASNPFTKDNDGKWTDKVAGREPQFDDQSGLWRVQEFKGYLGDLSRTIVSLPLKDAVDNDGVERMSANTILPGLTDIGIGIDGRYHVKSAKGIVLEKTVAIPVPKERIAPDDPTGDNPDNYKAAGTFGTGTDHDKVEATFSSDQAGLRSMLRMERHALIYSHFANLPFIRHEKDWLLPTELQTIKSLGIDKATYDPETTVENMKFWMPLPKSVEVDVDHRGKAKYYSGRAFVEIDEDGSIILEDAYGSQIRMEGGNIFISARNDVVLQPGRTVQTWAPRDIILKAGNSVDMTASLGDVRIKAQGNLMAVAVDKGVLIEAQDKGSTPDWEQTGEDVESRGVVLRAMDSKISTLSKDAYFRAGARDNSLGELHLDAAEGKGDVFLHGGTITNRALSEYKTIVGSTGDNANTTSMGLTVSEFVLGGRNMNQMYFGSANTTFGHEEFPTASLTVLGNAYVAGDVRSTGLGVFGRSLLVDGGIIAHGSAIVDGSAIFTKSVICETIASDSSNGFLPTTGDGFKARDTEVAEHPTIASDRTADSFSKLSNKLSETRTNDNKNVTDIIEELYSDDSLFAGSVIINKASFSFRTPKQYGTDSDFKWFETRWQQMNRTMFNASTVWRENSIVDPHSGKSGMPYPGEAVWSGDGSFTTLNTKLFNSVSGVANRLSGTDVSSAIAEPEDKSFSSAYVVTAQSIE